MTNAEKIKARLDVATVLGSYLKLDKAGANLKARCPFHSEKTASFFVSPARDIWHCFGCGKGGDIFQFVMDMEGADFPEALKILAAKAGVELTYENKQSRSKKDRILSALEESAEYFQSNLEKNAGAKEYIKKRKVNGSSVKIFRIGFAEDGWQNLYDFLKSKNYQDSELEASGLVIKGGRGYYDRFRSRIIFPLMDSFGRVIGFGGRVFGDTDSAQTGAKYINTPQTMLYDKSRFLYGLSNSKTEIRRESKAVVVEGYFDAVLSYQAGVRNVVAVSGTSLTESHIKVLRRLAGSLVFAFDKDSAGLAAAKRAFKLAAGEDFTVSFADMRGGKDPADIAAVDAEKWRSFVNSAKDGIAYFLEAAVGEKDVFDAADKKAISAEVLPIVAGMANEIEKDHWVKVIAREIQASADSIWKELGKYASSGDVAVADRAADAPTQVTRKARLEERLAGIALLKPQLCVLGELPAKDDCSMLSTGELFALLPRMSEYATKEQFLDSLPEDLKRDASRYLFEAEIFAEQVNSCDDEFISMLRSWKELSLKEKLASIQCEIEKLQAAGDDSELQERVAAFSELTRRLAGVIGQHNYKNEKKES